MGLTEDLEPCDFFDDKVWWRGIADLVILDGDTARVVDYKTSKSAKYADKGQLELMALATFQHFPSHEVIADTTCVQGLVKDTYHRDTMPVLWGKWLANYKRMETAHRKMSGTPIPVGYAATLCCIGMCSQWEQLDAVHKVPPPYKRALKQRLGEHADRMERQRTKATYDKKGMCKGEDVSHKKALSKGGRNKDGTRLESPGKTVAATSKKK